MDFREEKRRPSLYLLSDLIMSEPLGFWGKFIESINIIHISKCITCRDHKRLNVAITRAKKHLAIICDTETVTVHQEIREFLQYVKNNGTWKRPNPIDVNKAILRGPKHLGNNFLPIAQLTRSNVVVEHIDRAKVLGKKILKVDKQKLILLFINRY